MKLYRCDVTRCTDGPRVYLNSFMVVKETRCGYWIEAYEGLKWVSATGKKRFAYPTKDEAINSFHARKRRYLQILFEQARMTRVVLAINTSEYIDWEHSSQYLLPDTGPISEFKQAVLDQRWLSLWE
jgi:hypothetical protein